MSFSTLRVHLDLEGPPNAARLRVAAALAERWDGPAIGIVACDSQPLGYAGAPFAPPHVAIIAMSGTLP